MELIFEDRGSDKEYRLSFNVNGTYFLQYESGEGMGLSDQNLFDMINAYYKANF